MIRLLIYGAILAAVGAIAWNIVSTYNGAIKREAEAKAAVKERDTELIKKRGELKGAEEAITGWKKQLEDEKKASETLMKTLAERELERDRIKKERDDARRSLAQLRTDKPTASWLDQPLPPLVLERLRRGPPADARDGGGREAPKADRSPAPAVAPR
ncbi:MAG: hypothetical protein ACREJC_01995 [Tepidisphaeraceae bacterium]